MNTSKRLYESTIILNSSFEDHQIEAAIARIQENIIKLGGENVVVYRWGRKRLAYSIKKKNNGYYVLFEFYGPPTIVKPLEQFYRFEEYILRYLTIHVNKKAIKAREQRPIPTTLPEQIPTIDEILDLEPEPLFDDIVDEKVD